jgi:predicted dehydrogenase
MKKIRLGMIGGGQGSFIGAIHRRAAALDGYYELVCGAFSSDAANSRHTGEQLNLAPQRVYDSYNEMLVTEASLPAGERMQAVAIVTPNHLHAGPVILALQHGFHVIVDKPLALTVVQAKQIALALQQSACKLALTHTYAGYPMIKEARHRVASGQFGRIRKILVEYPQGWLSTALDSSQHKQASWRTDPGKAGAGAVGDIGTHAAHLAEYVSGLKITELCAELNAVVPGRQLDDDASALLHFEHGASGVLIATQVAAGEENNVSLRIYGELGGLEWSHQDNNLLRVKMSGQPEQIYRSGAAGLCTAASLATRLPAGHPEGFIEAFANIYSAFALDVSGNRNIDQDYPSIQEGLRGMAFIETMMRSAVSTQKWTTFEV